MTKSELIKKIFKLIGNPDPDQFDKLHDKSEQYLTKYLKVIENL